MKVPVIIVLKLISQFGFSVVNSTSLTIQIIYCTNYIDLILIVKKLNTKLDAKFSFNKYEIITKFHFAIGEPNTN